MGKLLVALSWFLKQRVGGRSMLAQVLEAGCVQKGSHWGACSEKLEYLALWEEPTTGVLRAPWQRL